VRFIKCRKGLCGSCGHADIDPEGCRWIQENYYEKNEKSKKKLQKRKKTAQIESFE
jgi:hypothetical protein